MHHFIRHSPDDEDLIAVLAQLFLFGNAVPVLPRGLESIGPLAFRGQLYKPLLFSPGRAERDIAAAEDVALDTTFAALLVFLLSWAFRGK
jgi:hypothetical protein